jgi:hypothetical protein
MSRQGQQDKEFEQVASVQQGSRQTCFGLVNTSLLGRLPTFSLGHPSSQTNCGDVCVHLIAHTVGALGKATTINVSMRLSR